MKDFVSFIVFFRAAFLTGFFALFRAGEPSRRALTAALAISALAFPSFASDLVILEKTQHQARKESQLWFTAVRRGDAELMEDLYRKNPNLISQKDEAGHSAFELSFFEKGQRSAIDWLLKKGFSADTALILALSGKTPVEIIEWLLSEKGASASAMDAKGQPALSKAVVFDKMGAALALLKSGAEIDALDFQGRSPLMEAVTKESLSFVRLLLQHGANPDIADKADASPLMIALQLKSADITEELLRGGADPNFADSNGMTALMKSALYVGIGIIDKLLEHGADINTKDTEGQTPLIKAISKERKIEDIQRLLAHGANPNIADKSGMTPLVKAILYGRLDIVRALLSYEADIKGQAILIKAIWIGELETAQKLLAHGADPEEADGRGRTPLMEAAKRGKPEIALALLKYGANPLAEDKESKRAIDYIELEKAPEGAAQVRQILQEAMEGSFSEKNPSQLCHSAFGEK